MRPPSREAITVEIRHANSIEPSRMRSKPVDCFELLAATECPRVQMRDRQNGDYWIVRYCGWDFPVVLQAMGAVTVSAIKA
jgi:hypothetical protein